MQIDLKAFDSLIEQGYIKSKKHPKLDLLIWNYTQKTQFDQMWLPETLICRGLITDLKGNVVERPFAKFFNFEEHVDKMGGLLPEIEPIVTEKLDGSLGILYKSDDGWAISTRGSFTSEQAKKGTEILRKKYPDFEPKQDATYLFEIIYPENKIVIDYKGDEDLIFLGLIDRKTGWGVELDHALPMPATRRWDYDSMEEMMSEKNTDNREGFVMYYPKENLRLKVKFAEYVRLHRLLTGITAKTVWEYLRDGKSIDELVKDVPDEFYHWVDQTAGELRETFNLWKKQVEKIVGTEIPTGDVDRKEQAKYIIKNHAEDSKMIFASLDGKNYDHTIWKRIKPAPETPFSNQDEK